jgi:hypothetical protein
VSINRNPIPPITSSSSMVCVLFHNLKRWRVLSIRHSTVSIFGFYNCNRNSVFTFPTAKESISRLRTNSILFSNSLNWVLSANSTSSSAKSSSSSIREAKFNSSSVICYLVRETAICCIAIW